MALIAILPILSLTPLLLFSLAPLFLPFQDPNITIIQCTVALILQTYAYFWMMGVSLFDTVIVKCLITFDTVFTNQLIRATLSSSFWSYYKYTVHIQTRTIFLSIHIFLDTINISRYAVVNNLVLEKLQIQRLILMGSSFLLPFYYWTDDYAVPFIGRLHSKITLRYNKLQRQLIPLYQKFRKTVVVTFLKFRTRALNLKGMLYRNVVTTSKLIHARTLFLYNQAIKQGSTTFSIMNTQATGLYTLLHDHIIELYHNAYLELIGFIQKVKAIGYLTHQALQKIHISKRIFIYYLLLTLTLIVPYTFFIIYIIEIAKRQNYQSFLTTPFGIYLIIIDIIVTQGILISFIQKLKNEKKSSLRSITFSDVNEALRHFSNPQYLSKSKLSKLKQVLHYAKKKNISEGEALRKILEIAITYFRPTSPAQKRTIVRLRYEILRMMLFEGATESQMMWDLGFDSHTRYASPADNDPQPRYTGIKASEYGATSQRSFKRIKKEAVEMLKWKLESDHNLQKERSVIARLV